MSQSQTASTAEGGTIGAPAMLVRTMGGQITLWSPAMERRYGFTAGEAVGRISHQLLRTVFWKPLHEVQAALAEQRSWRGGLLQRHASGRLVLTAHYWHLHGHADPQDVLVTELHSDIVLAGTRTAAQLADVIAAATHELSQALTATGNYVTAADRALQPAWPDKARSSQALMAAAGQIDRIKEGMRLFREVGEALRGADNTAGIIE